MAENEAQIKQHIRKLQRERGMPKTTIKRRHGIEKQIERLMDALIEIEHTKQLPTVNALHKAERGIPAHKPTARKKRPAQTTMSGKKKPQKKPPKAKKCVRVKVKSHTRKCPTRGR